MAERRLHGLQRVLGTNALFATAYGNVGSSIYYALGLVASYALGLTPVIFVITGVFFYMTAASYAEATAMFPEAGASSSFARRAFMHLSPFVAAEPRRQRRPGRRADLEPVPARRADRHARLHRHRDDLEHGRGVQERVDHDPGCHQPGPLRGLRHLLHAARRRAERPAGEGGR